MRTVILLILALRCLTLPAWAQTPVAAYGFEEPSGSTAVNSSGLAGPGTLSGAVRAPGRHGQGIQCDGVNDWVTVPDHPSLDLTNRMTLMAWVFPTGGPASYQTILAKERGAGNANYMLYVRGNWLPDFEMSGGTAYPNVHGPAPIPLNAWTHLAATFDGAAMRLYVNGTEMGSRASTTAAAVSSGPLRFCGNAAWPTEWFQGRLDEVRLYNRVLSPAEIRADMASPVVSGQAPQGSPGALSVVVSLGRVLLWDAPTTQADGKPLTALAGYLVYACPAQPCAKASGVAVGQVAAPSPAPSPGTTGEFELPNAVSGFSFVTAVDTSSRESAESNVVALPAP